MDDMDLDAMRLIVASKDNIIAGIKTALLA
jgi:hypothetical protein